MHRRLIVRAAVSVTGAAMLILSLCGTRSAASAVSVDHPPTTLYAGQQLVAGTRHDELSTRSYEFQLCVNSFSMTLSQFAKLPGPNGVGEVDSAIWTRDDPTGRRQGYHNHTRLRLSRRGNLALLTSSGHVLWATHTKAGPRSRLTLTPRGNLVLRTGAGYVAWTSHTSAVFLAPGRSVRSGRHLTYWLTDQTTHDRTTLTMQRNGDLVYRCNTTVLWRTRTRVKRSYLVMQRNGNLVIRGPKERAIWSTRTAGSALPNFLDTRGMQVIRYHGYRTLWTAKIIAGRAC